MWCTQPQSFHSANNYGASTWCQTHLSWLSETSKKETGNGLELLTRVKTKRCYMVSTVLAAESTMNLPLLRLKNKPPIKPFLKRKEKKISQSCLFLSNLLSLFPIIHGSLILSKMQQAEPLLRWGNPQSSGLWATHSAPSPSYLLGF